jgi:hypothetical protein
MVIFNRCLSCVLLFLSGCSLQPTDPFPDINTAPFGPSARESRFWHGNTQEEEARASDSLTLEAQRLGLLAEGEALRAASPDSLKGSS